jgi:hypothetical protein
MKTAVLKKGAVVVAVCMLLAAGSAGAYGAEAKYVNIETGKYDLLRAHSERSLVIFGQEVQFKKYNVVKMLQQYFTVASDIPGGVRYQVQENGGERRLIID